jgi:hypothetical protein
MSLTPCAGYQLDLNDMDSLRIFSWQVQNNLTRSVIAQLPFVFPDRPIPTWKVIMARALHLAGVEPVFVDCCVNSCMAYTGPHEKLKACTWCKQRRCDTAGRPRKRFCYIPLIPRLKMHQHKPKSHGPGWARMVANGDRLHVRSFPIIRSFTAISHALGTWSPCDRRKHSHPSM